ncbi:hypothetical protein Tco_1154987 [Tanacetum coccineum]
MEYLHEKFRHHHHHHHVDEMTYHDDEKMKMRGMGACHVTSRSTSLLRVRGRYDTITMSFNALSSVWICFHDVSIKARFKKLPHGRLAKSRISSGVGRSVEYGHRFLENTQEMQGHCWFKNGLDVVRNLRLDQQLDFMNVALFKDFVPMDTGLIIVMEIKTNKKYENDEGTPAFDWEHNLDEFK